MSRYSLKIQKPYSDNKHQILYAWRPSLNTSRINTRSWLCLKECLWEFPLRIFIFHLLSRISHYIIAEIVLEEVFWSFWNLSVQASYRDGCDLLGTSSAGINFAASTWIFSGSSWPALLKTAITLALFRRILSKSWSRFSRTSGVQSVRVIPNATASSIAWAPPWPWSADN